MPTTTPGVLLHSFTQPHMLREAMRDADIRHGEPVRVNIPGVRIPELDELYADEPLAVRLCNIESLVVLERPARRAGNLPRIVRREDVLLIGADQISALEPGDYELRNVLLFTNGHVQLTIDDQSEIVPWSYDEEPAFATTVA